MADSQKFSKLTWLKRTNGHAFKPADFRVLVSIYNHSDAVGRNSYPGRDRIAQETCLMPSTVSEAVQRLIAAGWIREADRGNGVTGRYSKYELVPHAPALSMSAHDDIGMSASEDIGMSAPADTNQILLPDHESDPLEGRAGESPTHQGTSVDPASFGPSLPMGEVMDTEPSALRATPWPRDKPIPYEPFSTPFVDEETGARFDYTPGELPRLAVP